MEIGTSTLTKIPLDETSDIQVVEVEGLSLYDWFEGQVAKAEGTLPFQLERYFEKANSEGHRGWVTLYQRLKEVMAQSAWRFHPALNLGNSNLVDILEKPIARGQSATAWATDAFNSIVALKQNHDHDKNRPPSESLVSTQPERAPVRPKGTSFVITESHDDSNPFHEGTLEYHEHQEKLAEDALERATENLKKINRDVNKQEDKVASEVALLGQMLKDQESAKDRQAKAAESLQASNDAVKKFRDRKTERMVSNARKAAEA